MADAFAVLAENELLPREHLSTFSAMATFRNRLVHFYAEVSLEEVFRILHENLADFRLFIASISAALLSGQQ